MKYFLSCCLILVFYVSCKKGECNYQVVTTVAPQNEQMEITDYLNTKSITGATKHPNGFYYIISNAGDANKPVPCSIVSFQYRGRLKNDSTFDQTPPGANMVERLGVLNGGIQLGLSLVGIGGQVQIFVPPSLGYGYIDLPNSINPVIPANSMLIYELSLMNVK